MQAGSDCGDDLAPELLTADEEHKAGKGCDFIVPCCTDNLQAELGCKILSEKVDWQH